MQFDFDFSPSAVYHLPSTSLLAREAESVYPNERLEVLRMTPLEHFRRMVASGLINARGEVTRLIGGDAEPEPGARRPNAAVSKNGE